MTRITVVALTLGLSMASAVAADGGGAVGSRTVIEGGNQQLSAGAAALRAGRYDEGIELTLAGLKRAASTVDRAAGLSNLCAAYAAKRDARRAIERCTESIALYPANWRAYSNRAFAFVLAGRVADAKRDWETAVELAPEAGAPQLETIREMIERASQTAQLAPDEAQPPQPPQSPQSPQSPTIRASAS